MKNITNKRKYSNALEGKLNTVGKNIFTLRTEQKLSRQKLSNRLMLKGVDISTQSIYDIEVGKRTVLDYELCAIAKELNTSADELLQDFSFKLDNDWFTVFSKSNIISIFELVTDDITSIFLPFHWFFILNIYPHLLCNKRIIK